MTGDRVPDLTPRDGGGAQAPPACPGCPAADVIERKESEARTAAWAGVLVAILGVLSWHTYGFLVCAAGAMVFGLYARGFAPREALADFAAGALLLGVLGLRLAGVI